MNIILKARLPLTELLSDTPARTANTSTPQMGLDPRLPNHRRVFSCSAVPLGLQWLFSTFSAFFKPSTPGRQMRPAEKPTGVFFFRDPQETCTRSSPCAWPRCWERSQAGCVASLLSQAWPLQSPLLPCLQRGC